MDPVADPELVQSSTGRVAGCIATRGGQLCTTSFSVGYGRTRKQVLSNPWLETDADAPTRTVGPKSSLTRLSERNTLYDMKTSTLTIRLDKDLNDLLTKASRRSGRNRSEIAREALRRQLRISQFEALRRKIMPFAEARGYLTDEDVFADVS